MGKVITVTMKGGKPAINTSGFAGDSCLKATARLEEALGGDVGDRDFRGYETEEGQTERGLETN